MCHLWQLVCLSVIVQQLVYNVSLVMHEHKLWGYLNEKYIISLLILWPLLPINHNVEVSDYNQRLQFCASLATMVQKHNSPKVRVSHYSIQHLSMVHIWYWPHFINKCYSFRFLRSCWALKNHILCLYILKYQYLLFKNIKICTLSKLFQSFAIKIKYPYYHFQLLFKFHMCQEFLELRRFPNI